jgi:2,4-diaminopentanoate dehydrogenase
MELVGVYAHGADKVGVDAAELAGWPESTGVTATNDIEALIALQPDACCYNPLWPDVDELARLLESGVNVCPAPPGSPVASKPPRIWIASEKLVRKAIRRSSAAAPIRA